MKHPVKETTVHPNQNLSLALPPAATCNRFRAATGLNEKWPGFGHPVMEAGFIFTADWHPGSDGLTHFRDDPNQEPDSAPFDPRGVAFKRRGCLRSVHRSTFSKNVHDYYYPPPGLAATRVFPTATGKTLGPGLRRRKPGKLELKLQPYPCRRTGVAAARI